MTVSVVKFDGTLDSIGRAIEMCGGFDRLDKNHRILIKPNITFSGWMPIPPYGMVTTSIMIEGILRHLLDHGCKNIIIGEGTVAEVLGSNTRRGFKYTGIDRVARRYGARLVDLNEEPFETIEIADVRVGVSRIVLDADFVINVPVLKTHPQVKVSLGLKNLKGCIDIVSRKRFHHKGLERMISYLSQFLDCDLTIIDGIYMLEKGADTLMGTAYRKNIIIASRDALACDCVGAKILGIDPSQIGYLHEYAALTERSADMSTVQVVGEDIDALQEKLSWESMAEEELLTYGITGLSVPHPGDSLCSGCYGGLICALGIFAKSNPNQDCGDAWVYWGRQKADGGAGRKMVLFGDCAISKNRDKNQSTRIKGCPPSIMSTLLPLLKVLLSRPRLLRTILLGSPLLLALRLGIYSGNLPKWKRYRSAEFDPSHFRLSIWQRIKRF
ncbi:MAG: DUF362 domain-containing protein [Dehalococcoidia bacterium]|nr:MAG: DUF362 domain-containing protein [Dehalococcoidia bacterium]